MRHSVTESTPITSNSRLLLAYAADLELEADRLRKQGRFVRHEAQRNLEHIQSLCVDAAGVAPPLAEVRQTNGARKNHDVTSPHRRSDRPDREQPG